MGRQVRVWRWAASLAVAFSLLNAGCPQPDSDDATDDDSTGCDDDSGDDDIAGDDDSTGDDDSADDDSAGDDDTTPAGACGGHGADLVVPADQPTIQAALDIAIDGDRICVEPGTYTEQLDFLGKAVEVISAEGAEQTMLSGGGVGPVVTFCSGEGPQTVLRGFTVTDGEATEGAGLLVQHSSPTLVDLIIRGNSAIDHGGGIAIEFGEPTLVDSRIEGCEAGHSGGGIAAGWATLYLSGVRFDDNMAFQGAGALHAGSSFVKGDNLVFEDSFGYEAGALSAMSSDVELSHTVFIGNAAEDGGGLAVNESTVRGSNLIFVDNAVSDHGGGIEVTDWYEISALELHNVTILSNVAGDRAGAVDGGGEGVKRLTNAIIAQNTVVTGNCGGLHGWEFTVRYSDAWENEPQIDVCVHWADEPGNREGNTPDAPQFLDTSGVDPSTWDLHLDVSSPLVDAGDPTLLDPDGSISDMGAFGGPGAAGWDLDSDGYPAWWQPGPYDVSTYPAQGWDCDDLDPDVFPGSGC